MYSFPSFWRHSHSARVLLPAFLLLTFGMMPLLPRTSGGGSMPQTQGSQSLRQGSNPLLPLLSEQMDDLQRLEEYQRQRERLYQESLKDNEGLKALLQKSGETISGLNLNLKEAVSAAEQMGERLQEADMWNAELQAENLRLEKKIAGKNTVIVALCGILAMVVFAAVIFVIRKIKKFIP